MGRASWVKARRGEQECVRYFRALGLEAQRVSPLEAGRVLQCDVLVGGPGQVGWPVQVKSIARNCPALPVLMANAHIGYVKYTRGRTFVVVDADDLLEFATMVAAARSE